MNDLLLRANGNKYHSPPLHYTGICYTLELYHITNTNVTFQNAFILA
jgi:hypothetical protein